MLKATLRLFNAIQIRERSTETLPEAVVERTVRNGYLIDPAILPDEKILGTIESIIGISGEKANAAFHKSWAIVKDSPMERLVMQQMIHYVTTYGFEQMDIYREDAVYIPHEQLELPAIQKDIPLVVIKGLTADELLGSVVSLGSGIALAQETLDDIMTIVRANAYDIAFVEEIKNRELKALLYDYYDIAPTEPVEFLRYLIGRLTGESLLIKNDALIGKIKDADGIVLDGMLDDAPDDLASIFFRFKPLFLALKSISRRKSVFNRLRKDADKLHRPLPEDYLNSVTTQIKRGILDLPTLAQRLEKAPIFRKIRLAYALNYRLQAAESTVYRVRNGRGWASEFEWPSALSGVTRQALKVVLAMIAEDICSIVGGKTIYIPPNVHYALPATEKQFTGHLPSGSFFTVPTDMIVGIHWTNTHKRVDLDLSVISESGKIGWDAEYRSGDGDVLFSGDMTDAPAPNGASELFYLKGGVQPKILMLNFFNFQQGDEVEGKIILAQDRPGKFNEKYMVDVNKMVASVNITITRRQNVLGLITSVHGENRFCFANISVGGSITATHNIQSTYARQYLVGSFKNPLDFRQILTSAGALVVDIKPDEGSYIDLSPEMLDKSTIIDLIKA